MCSNEALALPLGCRCESSAETGATGGLVQNMVDVSKWCVLEVRRELEIADAELLVWWWWFRSRVGLRFSDLTLGADVASVSQWDMPRSLADCRFVR